MKDQSILDRLSALEKEVSDLKRGLANGNGQPGWLAMVGTFAGDEAMKEVDRLALAYREADRRRARRRWAKKRAKK